MTRERSSRRSPLVALVLLAQFLAGPRSRSEDHVDYKFELYQEEDDRIKIITHSMLFEKALNASLTLKGEYVYDGISGASPNGAPPPPGSHQVPLSKMQDVRNAGNLELDWRLGNHTIRPQFSYSSESDYTSTGIALNDAIDFNDKNTTLLLGLAHNFDNVQPIDWLHGKHKDSTDLLIGLNQLLDPHTTFSADFTLGYSDGYLSDPYKLVRFDGYPDPTGVFPEKRPGHKSREIIYLSLTHFFEKVNGSLEGSYRFYHDSFDINAQTVGLAWYQKIGRHVIVSPMFRYYYQTAASFYAVRFPGDPSDPESLIPIPHYYSADYRLSEMETFSYGGKVIYQINDHFRIDAAYKRYEMHGLDGVTSQSAYPKANVITLGASWCF